MIAPRRDADEALLLLPEARQQQPVPSPHIQLDQVPAIIGRCSAAATFAWHEFFEGGLPNRHTRIAYRRAIAQFLDWCELHRLDLVQVTPGHVGQYFVRHRGSIPTKKQHLAALKQFFDRLVIRHVLVLNPAASVRGERYQAIEGKTPEISVEQARQLLNSIPVTSVVGLRDRAIIGILIYTAARVGAVARLLRQDLQSEGSQWLLRFQEKGGKHRQIPVRHNLQDYLHEYLAGVPGSPQAPLFPTTIRKTKILTPNAMTAADMCRMAKRRMRQAGLPAALSPHSFRVATITNLLEQGVQLEDVQYLAGHADPRTTRLYDRRPKRITRSIVERISI